MTTKRVSEMTDAEIRAMAGTTKTDTARIWRCACGTLNDAPALGDDWFCGGCRFANPLVETLYLAQPVGEWDAAQQEESTR